MIFQRIAKTATSKLEMQIESQFAPRPFAPITQHKKLAPHHQGQATQGLIQTKTNLLEIPNFRIEPKKTNLPNQPVQAKLTIGEPGDKYEQEADTIAHQVVEGFHTPKPSQTLDITHPQSEIVQRIKAKVLQQPGRHQQPEIQTPKTNLLRRPAVDIQRQKMLGEELQAQPILQRKIEHSRNGMTAPLDLEAFIKEANSAGQPLSPDTQESIGQEALGADLSPIKVHKRMPNNKAVNQLNPSEIQQIYSKFAASKRQKKLEKIVWEGHLEAISNVCKKYKYTIAIRETGPLSIRRIAEGAKAKPHTILEKSIKESSVKKGYNNRAQEVLRKLEQWDLDGFVGHWNANNELIGLRIDNIPPQVERQVYVQRDNGMPYVPLNVNLPGGGLAILRIKRVTGWKQYLYTGDYDLHEVYSAGIGGGQIAEATPEKVRLLNRLNKGIQSQGRSSAMRSGKAELQGDPKRVHVEGEYAMFQHGDQATYRMNQHLEAQEMESSVAQLVQEVSTESDEPIAWCRMGKWFVTLDKYEHDVFRIMHGIKKPHTWSDEGDQRMKRGKRTESISSQGSNAI